MRRNVGVVQHPVSVAIALSLVVPSLAAAQQVGGYVGGAFAISNYSSSTPMSPDIPSPGIGGTAPGMVAAVAAQISPLFSVAFELSQAKQIATVQTLSYLSYVRTQYDSHHRDLIMSGLLHFAVTTRGRVRPEAVGGLSVVRAHTTQREATDTVPSPARFTSLPVFGPYDPERSFINTKPGIAFGADLVLQSQ